MCANFGAGVGKDVFQLVCGGEVERKKRIARREERF